VVNKSIAEGIMLREVIAKAY